MKKKLNYENTMKRLKEKGGCFNCGSKNYEHLKSEVAGNENPGVLNVFAVCQMEVYHATLGSTNRNTKNSSRSN